jgi:transcriptional regulatory protein ASH1
VGYDLPKFSSVLNSAQINDDIPVKLKPITPMASLDYLDTNNYYRADNQWKYDLLHKLDKNLEKSSSTSTKPVFDSKISPKFEQLHPNIKQINFPYESNYTYLNKTYMNDIENYPQYLELARSLVELSRSKPNTVAKVHNNDLPSEELVDSSLPPLSTFTTNHTKSSPRQTPTSPSPNTTQRKLVLPMRSSYIPEYVPMRHEHSHEEHIHHDRKASITPQTSPRLLTSSASQTHKFIPITPPSSTKKIHSNGASVPKSPPRNNQRVCISCGSDQSPCWRPSWSVKEGQLCNSCGLRYKKTSARCLNDSCRKIPAKGEWSLMQSKGRVPFEDGLDGYSCLECGWRVEVKKG